MRGTFDRDGLTTMGLEHMSAIVALIMLASIALTSGATSINALVVHAHGLRAFLTQKILVLVYSLCLILLLPEQRTTRMAQNPLRQRRSRGSLFLSPFL